MPKRFEELIAQGEGIKSRFCIRDEQSPENISDGVFACRRV